MSGRPAAMAPPVALQVNGRVHSMAVDGRVPLLQVLRNDYYSITLSPSLSRGH